MDPDNRRSLLALVAVALAGVAGAGIAWWLAVPPVTSPDPATPAASRAESPPIEPALEEEEVTEPAGGASRAQPPIAVRPAPNRPGPPARRGPPPPPPPAPPSTDLLDGIEAFRDEAELRVEEQLRLLARSGVSRGEHEQARALLEVELEHVAALKRDSVLGGLDAAVAKHEYKRVRRETDDALDALLGAALRQDLRALE